MFGGFCWPYSFDRSLLSNVGRYQIIYRLPNASLWVPVALLEIPQACIKISRCYIITAPDSKVHGAKMGPIWGRQDPGGPHVGPMNFAIWGSFVCVWRKCKASCMYCHRATRSRIQLQPYLLLLWKALWLFQSSKLSGDCPELCIVRVPLCGLWNMSGACATVRPVGW